MLSCADSKLKNWSPNINKVAAHEIGPRPRSAQSDDALSEFMNPAFDVPGLPVDQRPLFIHPDSRLCQSVKRWPRRLLNFMGFLHGWALTVKTAHVCIIGRRGHGEMTGERTGFSVAKALCVYKMFDIVTSREDETRSPSQIIRDWQEQLCIYDSGWLSLCWTLKH